MAAPRLAAVSLAALSYSSAVVQPKLCLWAHIARKQLEIEKFLRLGERQSGGKVFAQNGGWRQWGQGCPLVLLAEKSVRKKQTEKSAKVVAISRNFG